MTITIEPPIYHKQPGLSAFCDDLFCSLARSDQRRWGEIYVRGLVTVPGRKSVKKISDLLAGGGAEQRLQQFVNQSTWDWASVRDDLARRLQPELQPRAWVIKEVVFPKNGEHSVGVGRQFVPSAGRLLNCQLALAVFLVGPQGSCPVNWRLILPPCWDDDHQRRERAKLPDEERCLPAWQHMLDALGEMITEWSLPPAPVVADIRHEQRVGPLAHGLDGLGLPYMLRVGENMPAVTVRTVTAGPRTLSFAELVAESIQRNTMTMTRWLRPGDRPGWSQFIVAPMPSGPLDGGHPSGHGPPGRGPAPRYVAADRPPARRLATVTWLTSMDVSSLPKLIELTSMHDRVNADLGQLDRSGLQHFEGRSFPGWHHYMTLVSMAHAWSHLYDLPAQN